MQELDFIVNGGETRRFHTWPVLREQRVDAHSFHVAMIYSLMAQDNDPATGVGLSVPGLMMCLTHDLPEHRMGDMPAPAKRGLPPVAVMEPKNIGGFTTKIPFRDYWNAMEAKMLDDAGLGGWEAMLSPLELRWFKLADVMEGCLYCIRERQLGNKLIAVPFGNFRSYIRDVLGDSEPAPMEAQIINYIDDMWEQANG